MAPHRVRIGRIWIDAVTFDGALDAISDLVRRGQGGSVFTPNVDHFVIAEDDPVFRAAYDEVSLCVADGKPVLWAGRLLGTPVPEKISGSDLVEPLLRMAARSGWRVFLLGGGPGVAEAAAERARKDFGVEVVGTASPFIRLDGTPGDLEQGVDEVAAARPDLVLAALGSPKQEVWIHHNRHRIGSGGGRRRGRVLRLPHRADPASAPMGVECRAGVALPACTRAEEARSPLPREGPEIPGDPRSNRPVPPGGADRTREVNKEPSRSVPPPAVDGPAAPCYESLETRALEKMTMKKTLAAALFSLVLAPVAFAAGPADTFQAKCAACHGKDGKGQSDMAKKLGVKDLTATKLPAAEIEKVIANGKGKMTPWKGKLSDAEISGLAKYVAGGLK